MNCAQCKHFGYYNDLGDDLDFYSGWCLFLGAAVMDMDNCEHFTPRIKGISDAPANKLKYPCIDGKRHRWKDGWICDKCGLRRADYEDMRKDKETNDDQD